MKKYKLIVSHYEILKKSNISSIEFSNSIEKIGVETLSFLNDYKRVPLNSKVEDKEYFAFASGEKISRPVRKDLFSNSESLIKAFFNMLDSGDFSAMTEEKIDKAAYTISIGFCCMIDLLKSNDKKTPGTFFEYFIGYCYFKRLKIIPKKSIEVLNLDKKTSLPTDYIFDLGTNKPKFHLPVKTSTRERVIQVWAHQRVIDGIYGVGRFLGTLVCLAETKLAVKKKEVTEICLPQQWQLYQLFIAQMKRVYYLDLPKSYADLNNQYPRIHVKPFSSFFKEKDDDLFS